VSAPSRAPRKTINSIVKAGLVSVSDSDVGNKKFYLDIKKAAANAAAKVRRLIKEQ
jgi:hypothetical protein